LPVHALERNHLLEHKTSILPWNKPLHFKKDIAKLYFFYTRNNREKLISLGCKGMAGDAFTGSACLS
jgi:hypothetical protein